MSDQGVNIDPNLVINDLLNQIQKLTADNTLLRVALQQYQSHTHSHAPEVAAPQDKSDAPDQTK